MKKNIENDRIYFNAYCESAKKKAVLLAAAFAVSLKLYELKTQSRLGRVNSEIDHIFEERKVLNRPLYILYAFDLASLFELFERMNYLQNPDEMAKLQQAITSVEKFHRLELLLIETFAMEEVENFKARQSNKYKKINNLQKKDDPANETSQPSLTDADKPKSKPAIILESFGCKVPEDHLKDLLPVMNKAFNFISPRTSPETVVRIMTCKNLAEIKDEVIYLGCKTIEFKCVLDNSHNLFSHISYADIGRSGLFVSTKGKVISETNLNSSKYDKTNNKTIIEKILL